METSAHRVGLDGHFLQQPTTGSGQVTLHLWHALRAGGDLPEVVLLQPAGRGPRDGAEQVVEVAPPPWAQGGKARKLWWEQRGAPRAARQARAGLLHVPYFAGPRVGRLPVVMTIHDVIPLLMPEYAGGAAMRLYLRLVSGAARRAAAVITDSQCSARDIEGWLGIPREKVHVIPLAADPRFAPGADRAAEAALRARWGLAGPVVFGGAGVDARKNLPALIEAFAQAYPQLDPATRLVIAGRAHSGNQRLYPPLEPVVRSFGLEGVVVLAGGISDDEKLTLYNLADVFVFPSLYEGFGLPPLEAMACGTPVISSNRSSLPEVVGSGGLLVEPSPARLAAALVSILSDERLRRDLTHRGLAQAAQFSWEQTAARTREVYRAVLDAAAGRKAGGHGGT